MTTQTQDTNEQQRARAGAPAVANLGAAAVKRQTRARQTDAGQAGSILGDSPAVCRGVVENAFGKRHWAAPWALELCAADSRFAIHLAEQPRGYAHYLCLIRMALLEQGASDSAPDDARMLRAGNKRKLLKELFPTCPAAMVNLLPKLPHKPLQAHEYCSLIQALADNKIRKHFLHIKRIKKFDILLANDALNFPPQFRAAAMRSIKDEDDYEIFWHIMHTANRIGLNVAEREVVQAADKLGACRLDDWLMEKVAGMPFPPPPWEGDDSIRPIRSLAELKSAGEKFNNCLSGGRTQAKYASSVATGDAYFYVCERMPALIEVERENFWGWRIDDMNGVKNKSLTSRQRHELTQRFMKAGIAPERRRRLRRRF